MRLPFGVKDPKKEAEETKYPHRRFMITRTPHIIKASRSFAQRRGAFLGKFFRPALVRCGDCVKKDGGDDFFGDQRRQEIIHSTWTLDPVIGCLHLSEETLCQFTGQTQPSICVGCDERRALVAHSYQ